MSSQDKMIQVLTAQRNQAMDAIVTLNVQMSDISDQLAATVDTGPKWEQACRNALTPEDFERVQALIAQG